MQGRAINPQQKMDQVVKAARTLFVNQGYHSVSIPQIVGASGVSIGAIYHHFGNKEGLARSVHERTLQQFQCWLADRQAGCASTREKLCAFAHLVFEVTEEDPEMMEYMLLMKHGEFLPDAQPICATEPFQQVRSTIGAAIDRGELGRSDPFLAAVAFTGVVLRAVELRLMGIMASRLTDVADDLFAHAWAAVSD